MQETIRKSPDEIIKLRESISQLIEPYMQKANLIIAKSLPKYLVTGDGLRVIYPYNTLKSLAAIRICAKQAIIAAFGFEVYNKIVKRHE